MTRVLTRTNFNSSKLIRILSSLSILDSVEKDSDFAEKLGLWVGVADAINLRAAQNPDSASQSDMPYGQRIVASESIVDEITRVRSSLAQSITKSNSASAGGARIRIALPIPTSGGSFGDSIAYEPYRRYYLAHQREMELHVRPLRSKVRSALAKSSPALSQLADIDAAFEGIFSERESKLLSTLPSLLEKRFKQLYKFHQLAQVDNPTEDTLEMWMTAGGWLARFCGELQTVLLAELDMRLQPTEGLMEALNNTRKSRYE
jgi:hypothetical protein